MIMAAKEVIPLHHGLGCYRFPQNLPGVYEFWITQQMVADVVPIMPEGYRNLENLQLGEKTFVKIQAMPSSLGKLPDTQQTVEFVGRGI